MLFASVGDVPDWIQALGVVVALGVSAYQLRQQAADAKESARRHEQAERDAAVRHRQEMDDRRRERLLTNYPVFAQGVEDHLSNMAVAEQLRKDRDRFARDAEVRNDPQAKQNAMTLQQGAMHHHALAQQAQARMSTAYLAIRFDESSDFLWRVEDVMAKVNSWRAGPTVDIAAAAFNLAHERGDAFRVSQR